MKVSDWHHAYRERWGKRLVPEAYAHPAKASYSLAQRIYEHAIAESWLRPGDCVLDPFGGVGGFAYHALYHGLHFVGVELEAKWATLGGQNIARWNARYSTLPGWGTAMLIQGDSRHLAALVGEAEGCVSSPPFEQSLCGGAGNSGIDWSRVHGSRWAEAPEAYGTHPANLGNMKAGDFDACLASPPYAGSLSHDADGNHNETYENPSGGGDIPARCYGTDPGNLGNMRPGDVNAVISSPPFTNQLPSHDNFVPPNDTGERLKVDYKTAYGCSPGQLGAMPAGGFEAAVSSPPYEGTYSQSAGGNMRYGGCDLSDPANWTRNLSEERLTWERNRAIYSENEGNIGNSTGDMFWEAARTIVEQVYTVLRPGAHAIWVLKAYVRDKRIVDFPDQWRQMCEACGFETLHVHRAWLVEDHGAQGTLDGGVKRKRTERKSFFRRLAESKGSPRIDYEIVLCQVKPVGTGSQSGQASACVSSPPYAEAINRHGEGPGSPDAPHGSKFSGLSAHVGYGASEGQLGAMRPGDFDAAVKPLNSNGKGDTQ